MNLWVIISILAIIVVGVWIWSLIRQEENERKRKQLLEEEETLEVTDEGEYISHWVGGVRRRKRRRFHPSGVEFDLDEYDWDDEEDDEELPMSALGSFLDEVPPAPFRDEEEEVRKQWDEDTDPNPEVPNSEAILHNGTPESTFESTSDNSYSDSSSSSSWSSDDSGGSSWSSSDSSSSWGDDD
jgi:hypothetical protein